MKILLEGFETRYEEEERESANSRVGHWKRLCLRNISQIRGKCSELEASVGQESTEKHTHCLSLRGREKGEERMSEEQQLEASHT